MAIATDIDLTQYMQTPEGARRFRDWAVANPDLWIENILNCSLWTIPKLIAKAVFTQKQDGSTTRVCVPACASVGKSHLAARVALAFFYNFRPCTVITTAPTMRQVGEILWREIAQAWSMARFNMGGELKQTRIDVD